MLLDAARRAGVDPAELAEWLYYEAGVRSKPSWESLERAVLRAREVTAQSLAAFLVELGVKVDEEEWLRLLGSGLSLHTPRKARNPGS
jgi:hypothetical protein